jgi:hypothetical protein
MTGNFILPSFTGVEMLRAFVAGDLFRNPSQDSPRERGLLTRLADVLPQRCWISGGEEGEQYALG